MAAATKKKGGGGTLAFLKKKELGLPVWAWGAIVAVGLFILYRRFNAGASASPTQAPASTDATTGDFPPADSGGGSAGGGSDGSTDTSGDLQGVADAINAEPQAIADLLGAQGFFGSDPLQDGTNPLATTGVAGVGALDWGGQPFATRAQFNAYLKSKGLSAAQFSTMHPAAYAHYLALPSGVTATKNSKKPGAPKTAVKSSRRTLASTVKHVGTAVTKTGTPRKAPVVTQVKRPLLASTLLGGKLQASGTKVFLQPSGLLNTQKTATKKVVPAPAPAKNTKPVAKPKPVAHPVKQNTGPGVPPKKVKK